MATTTEVKLEDWSSPTSFPKQLEAAKLRANVSSGCWSTVFSNRTQKTLSTKSCIYARPVHWGTHAVSLMTSKNRVSILWQHPRFVKRNEKRILYFYLRNSKLLIDCHGFIKFYL